VPPISTGHGRRRGQELLASNLADAPRAAVAHVQIVAMKQEVSWSEENSAECARISPVSAFDGGQRANRSTEGSTIT